MNNNYFYNNKQSINKTIIMKTKNYQIIKNNFLKIKNT